MSNYLLIFLMPQSPDQSPIPSFVFLLLIIVVFYFFDPAADEKAEGPQELSREPEQGGQDHNDGRHLRQGDGYQGPNGHR